MNVQEDRLILAVDRWVAKLNEVPGWRDWKKASTINILNFSDPLTTKKKLVPEVFNFTPKTSREHSIIMSYFHLHSTVISLKACEHYFRRYPFNKATVRKDEHLRYICEMYFGRVCEFRSRMKECLTLLKKEFMSGKQLQVHSIIKKFDADFEEAIRWRNLTHHHKPFEDIAIDNIFFLSLRGDQIGDKGWAEEANIAYRRASKEWAKRVVESGKRIGEYLEQIADLILQHCLFLSDLLHEKD